MLERAQLCKMRSRQAKLRLAKGCTKGAWNDTAAVPPRNNVPTLHLSSSSTLNHRYSLLTNKYTGNYMVTQLEELRMLG